MSRVRGLLHQDRGASSVEYGLVVVAIAAVIVGLVFAIGALTRSNISGTCTSWNTAAGGSNSC